MEQINLKLTPEDVARLNALRTRLQSRQEDGQRISNRYVILKALDRLEAHLDKLEHDAEVKRQKLQQR